jgi:DNA polymerase III subunit epsilon
VTDTVPGVEDATARGTAPGTPWPAGLPRSAVHGPLGAFGRPLAETDFVVVDLETTGGSPDHAVIMEIGAVRVRGRPADGAAPADAGAADATAVDAPPEAGRPADQPGEPDERVFSTLVNPGRPIPEHISALTGITGELVTGAPGIGQVLPAFLEFAAGAVLVAHNAPFDLAFLAAACKSHGLALPAVPVLDTAAVARRVLTMEEAPDCRLGTLARVFGAETVPDHRALDDAQATAAVLQGLIGRLAALGVHALDGVREITDSDAGCPPGPRRDRMLELTADVPPVPGVCLFLGAGGAVLHVVKSSDMRARVHGYFAVSETRRHIRELLEHTERLYPASLPTALAADVEEIRVIARHRPRYNDEPSAGTGPTPEAPGISPEIAGLARARRVVAAGPRFDGGWDLAVIEDGLLTASAALPPGGDPAAAADTRPAGDTGADGLAAERECVLRWLGSPGVRVIKVDR